jgi:hypothetical protein
MRLWPCLGALSLLGGSACGGDREPTVFRYRFEVLYTMHASVDTDAKLARVAALVMKAYPGAKIEEGSAEERRGYFLICRDRLLRRVGKNWVDLAKEAGADPDPKKEDEAVHERLVDGAYALVKDQVDREVALRAIYRFLYTPDGRREPEGHLRQAQGEGRPEEPGVRNCPRQDDNRLPRFRRERTHGSEIAELEDSGAKFGFSFYARVASLRGKDLPKKGRNADCLGDHVEGRQLFRLTAVKESEPTAPPAPGK